MAGELFVTYPSTATLYAVLRRVSDAQVWSVAASAWATWADASIGDYDIPLASRGGDLWTGDFPASIASGTDVMVTYYEQAGASPATTDLIIGRQPTRWITSTIGSGSGTDLISVARAQQCEQLADVDPTALAQLISDASAALVAWIGHVYAAQTLTEVYDGDGTSEMILDNFPIISLTSCTITDDDGTPYDIPVTNFRFNPKSGVVQYKPNAAADFACFPRGFQNVAWVYVAGYATIPDNAQRACIIVCCAFKSDDARDYGMQAETLGTYSYTREAAAAALPQEAKDLVQYDYKMRLV